MLKDKIVVHNEKSKKLLPQKITQLDKLLLNDPETLPTFNFQQLTREPRRMSIGILRPHLPLHE